MFILFFLYSLIFTKVALSIFRLCFLNRYFNNWIFSVQELFALSISMIYSSFLIIDNINTS